MKELILWIVIVVIGVFFEQIKKRIAARKQPSEPPVHLDEIPSIPTSWSNNTDYHMPEDDSSAMSHHINQPAVTPTQQASASAHITSKPSRYTPLENAEGECVSSDVETASTEKTPTLPDDSALQAHYARWRQAIIDSQLIERKYF